MKVFFRVLLKLFILVLTVAAAAGGAIGWRTYQRSEPGYIMDRYLTLLIEDDSEKAYQLLDQSEEVPMSREEYAEALQGRQYGLSADFTSSEIEKRTDNNGNEYVDFHVEFKDAEDKAQMQEDFIVKKQPEAAFGVFDQWKILSGHCMVKNLELTVPTGAQVYLDNEPADASWILRDETARSLDCYRIPSLLPGKISLVIRHPVFESLNTTLDTNKGSQDYSAQMVLKQSAQKECLELGVTALKQLYAAAVKEKTEGLDIFGACQEQAKQFVKDQGGRFHEGDNVFQNAAVSRFVSQYGTPVFTEGEDGAVTVELTLEYHYLLREDVMNDTGELLEDGTPVQEMEEKSRSGDNSAVFVMAYRDGAWSVASVSVPLISIH